MSLFDPNLLAQASVAPVAPAFVAPAGLGDDAWLAASKALAAVAHPQGMVRPFLPWQAAAYQFCNDSIARWGGSLLGDDMGMGKTQVMLALVADAVRTVGSYAIVIAPTVAETGYRQDLAAAFPHLVMHTVKGRTVKALPAADIYFMSDDPLTLKAWLGVETVAANGNKHIDASAWAAGAAIVCRDEIHRDKGNQGKPSVRSKVMLAVGKALRQAGKAIVGATGTLLTNRPVEAYLPLQIIGGEALVTAVTPGSSKASGFLWRYCNPQTIYAAGGRKITTFVGTDVDTANLLHEYLRRTVYVRREKTDLGEGVLPNSGWLVKPVALPMTKTVRLLRIERELYDLIREESGPAAALKAERAETIRKMMMMWSECGVAKAEAAVDYVKTLTDEGEQVVVFFHHTDVMLAMMDYLVKARISFNVINGSVTGDARIAAVDEFQAGDVQVCLANIKAAGMAVTLTAAPHAVFVQCPWSAGDLKQAADRVLRVDDRSMARAKAGESVTWHVLQTCWENGDPSFDAAIFKVLQDKAVICDAVNAGRPITITDDNMTLAVLEAWVPNAKRHGGW